MGNSVSDQILLCDHDLRARGKLGDDYLCDGDHVLGDCRSHQRSRAKRWHCDECNGDFCTLCKIEIYRRKAVKELVKPEVITKAEGTSDGAISSGGAESAAGGIELAGGGVGSVGSVRIIGAAAESAGEDISVKLDPDWTGRDSSLSKRKKKKSRAKKKKYKKTLKLLDKEKGRGYLLSFGAEIEIDGREGTFQGSDDAGTVVVKFDNGDIDFVPEKKVTVHYCDTQEVIFSTKCEDGSKFDAFKTAMKSLLEENDALEQSKIEENRSEGSLVTTAYFEVGNAAVTFSEYIMGDAFIIYLARRTKVGLIDIERVGNVKITSDRSKNVKLVPSFKCPNCNELTLKAHEMAKHLQLDSECYQQLQKSADSANQAYSNVEEFMEMDVDDLDDGAAREELKKLKSSLNIIGLETPERKAFSTLSSAVGKSTKGKTIRGKFRCGRGDFVALNQGMEGFIHSSSNYMRKITSLEELYEIIDINACAGIYAKNVRKRRKICCSKEQPFKLNWTATSPGGGRGICTFSGHLS